DKEGLNKQELEKYNEWADQSFFKRTSELNKDGEISRIVHKRDRYLENRLNDINKILEWQDYSRVRKFVSFKKKKQLYLGWDKMELRSRAIKSDVLMSQGEKNKALKELKKQEKLNDTSKKLYSNLAQLYQDKYKISMARRSRMLRSSWVSAVLVPVIIMVLLISPAYAVTRASAYLTGILLHWGRAFYLSLPYIAIAGGIIIAGFVVGHILHKLLIHDPASYKEKTLTYYDKAIEKDKSDIDLYMQAMNFSEETEDWGSFEKYAKDARQNIKPDEISNVEKQNYARVDLDAIKQRVLARQETIIGKQLKRRLRNVFQTRTKKIKKLKDVLMKINTAKKDIKDLSDEKTQKEQEDIFANLIDKAHSRIVTLDRWFFAQIYIKPSKRNLQKLELAKSIAEHAKALPENKKWLKTKEKLLTNALNKMKALQNKKGVPDMRQEISNLYFLLGSISSDDVDKKTKYTNALEFSSDNNDARIKLALFYFDFDETAERVPQSVKYLEKMLDENKLNDDDSIEARNKLMKFYSDKESPDYNMTLARKHKKALNELERKKDDKKEEYVISRKERQDDRFQKAKTAEILKTAKEWNELKKKKDRKQSAINIKKEKRGYQAGLISLLQKEQTEIEQKMANFDKEIIEMFNVIKKRKIVISWLNMTKIIKPKADPKDMIPLLNWILDSSDKQERDKSRINLGAIDKTKIKLILLENMFMPDGFLELSESEKKKAGEIIADIETVILSETGIQIDKIAKKIDALSPDEKILFYFLRLKLKMTSKDVEYVKSAASDIKEILNERKIILELGYDDSYDSQIIDMFVQFFKKMTELKLIGHDLPLQINSLLIQSDFTAIVSASSLFLQTILKTLLDPKLNSNNVYLLFIALNNKNIEETEKLELLKLFQEQLREMIYVRGERLDSTSSKDLLKNLKALWKNKPLREYISLIRGYIYEQQERTWLSRFFFWRAKRLSKALRGEAFFRSGILAFNRNNYKSALDYLNQAEKLGYTSAELYKKMSLAEQKIAELSAIAGNIELAERFFVSAIAHLNKARELDPKLDQAGLFELYLSMLRHIGANTVGVGTETEIISKRLNWITRVYLISPDAIDQPEVIETLYAVEILFKQFSLKNKRLNKALWAKILAFQAIIKIRSNELPEAEDQLYEALWFDQNCTIARLGLSKLAEKDGDFIEAINQYEKAGTIDPEVKNFHPMEIAKLYIACSAQTDDITKKIEYTKKAIALNDLTETKLGLCDLYLESGQIESSENLLVEMDKD
ncbi:MAG: hypothetical protein ABH869_03110, partial [Candidatus Omnitrophota bacterium]